MPNSITSVRQVGTDAKSFVVSINRCDTLAELVDLVPAPFRPRMQELVNRVYRAALKSNHARSYLSTLEKHRSDGTFPPEIAGRIHPPTIQISKEYTASADCKSAMAQIDTSSRHHKVAMLEAAINLKAAEVSYLQSVFAETSYSEEVKLIYSDVANQLGTDAGLTPDAEGSFSIQSMPSWIQDDCQIFVNTRAMYPQRAIAIAYAAVQKEMSKKFKSLSLKKRTDEDVEMQDSSSKSETVQSLINQSLEQFKKELKLQKPGMTASLSNTEENCLTDTPRQRKGPKGQKKPNPTTILHGRLRRSPSPRQEKEKGKAGRNFQASLETRESALWRRRENRTVRLLWEHKYVSSCGLWTFGSSVSRALDRIETEGSYCCFNRLCLSIFGRLFGLVLWGLCGSKTTFCVTSYTCTYLRSRSPIRRRYFQRARRSYTSLHRI